MLLGLDGERTVADRDTLFFSARVFVESLAMSGPTLLLFEDIHWADASQLDLLETLASRVRDVPVLFVALARPELLTDRPTWGGGLPAYTGARRSIRSATSSSQELAEQLLGGVGRRGRRARSGRDGGGQSALHRGARGLDRRAVDRRTSSRRASARIIAARLDSLPPDERSVLVDASVAGRVFWRGALAEMADHDEPRRPA